MKKIPIITAAIALSLFVAACGNKKEDISPLHTVEYVVSDPSTPPHVISVDIFSDDDVTALMNSLCNYTQQGKVVTFRGYGGGDGSVKKSVSKESTTISTTSRDEIIRWMARMEDAGMTVTVTYDNRTGTWHGTAYANSHSTVCDQGGRLARVTFDYSLPNTDMNYAHAVYNYTWSGDQLTAVAIVIQRHQQYYSNGTLVDTTVETHYSAMMTYNEGLRTSLTIYNDHSTLPTTIIYSYIGGQLVQEWHSEDEVYTFVYNDDGMLDHWLCTIAGSDITYTSSLYCSWQDGDMVSGANELGLTYCNAEYDNTLRPFGVTLGTSTLLPWYNSIFPPETQLSRHNMTHYYTDSKSQGGEMWINYTYQNGKPATAQTEWYDYGTASWIFEYVE